MRLPALIAHADWSKHARKRWLACATLQPGRGYRAHAPRLVGPLDGLLKCLEAEAGEGPLLLGFDFPLGLPRAYAKRKGIEDFVAALTSFEDGFYSVAALPNQISLDRPFYPNHPGRSGDCRRQHLLDRLGFAAWTDLLRRCDQQSGACAIFWTLGGQQVGKAAITGWRCLLAPVLRDGVDLALWPFHGRLDELLARHRFVVTETYPAEFYRHLGLDLKGGKGKQAVRQANAPALIAWANGAAVSLDRELSDQSDDGFGADARGDDRFDAVIGLFGMLNVVLGKRPPGEPHDQGVRRVEGWILGQ